MWRFAYIKIFVIIKFLVLYEVRMPFGFCSTFSTDFEPGGKPEVKLINPDAEAVIGAVLNIRERGSGLFGCGDKKLEGVIAANALEWTVDALNKKIWSESSSNISLGLYIMDSCGRTRTAATQLIDFLPQLQNNDKSLQENLPFKFCIIDGVGLANETDIIKSMKDINIFSVATNIDINSPQVLISSILLFVQELRWEHLVIFYSNSKFSSSMFKEFIKLLNQFDLCIPWMINVENPNESELNNIIKSGIPGLSLLSSEEHYLFLKLFQNFMPFEKKMPVLFSNLVTRNQLKQFQEVDLQIFTVIQYPEEDNKFENFYSKNSIMRGIRTEDGLDIVERTKIMRIIKQISEKLSEGLRSTMVKFCQDQQKLCTKFLTVDGRKTLAESLAKTDWADNKMLYELVEYRYLSSSELVHLHKIMAYNGHKNLEIFETSISFSGVDCDEKNITRLECQCLEIKNVRSASGRNIDDWVREKYEQPKHNNDKDENFRFNQNQKVDQVSSEPMMFNFLNNSFNGTLACLTLLGTILTLIIAQYFATFAALSNRGLNKDTSVLGYVILFGIFLLFSTNITFLLTPLISICVLRRFCSSFSYSIIFSGMLIKVWSSLQLAASERHKTCKPVTLFLYSGAFSFFQFLPSGLWFFLKPPVSEYADKKWVCYTLEDLDFHLIVSMIYPFLLLLITLILAIKTCSKSSNDEARWILISSSLIAVIFSCWSLAIYTRVWETHRTACTNLTAGTILLLCLYIPKIKFYSEFKNSPKLSENSSHFSTEINKNCPVIPSSPTFPVVLGYKVVAPVFSGDLMEPNYLSQSFPFNESNETFSISFDTESSLPDVDQEPHTFSTFLEEFPESNSLEIDDPTQVIPSALYPLEMFNNEAGAINSNHCQPGSNEFTPPCRTSQLNLNS